MCIYDLLKAIEKNPMKALNLARSCPGPYDDIELREICVNIIGDFGNKEEDLDELLKLLVLDESDYVEFRIRSNIYFRIQVLESIVKLDPTKSDLVINILDNELIPSILDDELDAYTIKYLLEIPSFIVPQDILFRWSEIPDLKIVRDEIFKKLTLLPKNETIENFFIQLLIDDDIESDLKIIVNNYLDVK